MAKKRKSKRAPKGGHPAIRKPCPHCKAKRDNDQFHTSHGVGAFCDKHYSPLKQRRNYCWKRESKDKCAKRRVKTNNYYAQWCSV